MIIVPENQQDVFTQRYSVRAQLSKAVSSAVKLVHPHPGMLAAKLVSTLLTAHSQRRVKGER